VTDDHVRIENTLSDEEVDYLLHWKERVEPGFTLAYQDCNPDHQWKFVEKSWSIRDWEKCTRCGVSRLVSTA
jgi:hypothetical protein